MKRTTVRTIAVGGVAIAALLVAACGNAGEDEDTAATTSPSGSTDGGAGSTEPGNDRSDEFVPLSGVPGVTDEEIAFAVVGTAPESSPLASCYLECYVAGVEAYFRYRNEQGGLFGRQLTISEVVDDQLGNNQVASLEVVQSGDSFGILAVPVLATGFADVAAAGVPLYTLPGAAPATAGQESSWVIGGSQCLSCVRPSFAYYPTIVGATRIASLGYGVSQAATDCVRSQVESIERYGPALGIEHVYSNTGLAFGLPNGIAPEVSAMREAGVDMVMVCIEENAVITLEGEMERQGIGDVPLLLPQAIGNSTLLETHGDLLDGSISFTYMLPQLAAGSNELLDTFLEYVEPIEGIQYENALYGWLNADLAYRGILAAGPEFDRASVIAATNALEDDTAEGLLPPHDWGRQHEPATNEDPVSTGPDPYCIVVAQVVDGAWSLVNEPEEPFSCWDPREYGEYTEPFAASFG